MTCAGILLAAGASRRFGTENKLLADLQGRPLVERAASALARAGCDHLIAMVSDPRVEDLLDGFILVRPDKGRSVQADSLRAGIACAVDLKAQKALVVLADMPFVSSRHLQIVAQRCTPGSPSASTDGTRRMPPACFPSDHFERLLELKGDHGAQDILRTLLPSALVHAPAEELRDIDTPAELLDAATGSQPR